MKQPPGWSDKSSFFSEKAADGDPLPKGFSSKSNEEMEAQMQSSLDALEKLTKKTSSSSGNALIKLLGAIALVIFAAIHGVIAYGYCGKTLWQWFAVPVFDFKPITLLQAYGIYVLVRLFTMENPFQNSDSMKDKPMPEKVGRIFGLMMIPWCSLLIGYIIKCWM